MRRCDRDRISLSETARRFLSYDDQLKLNRYDVYTPSNPSDASGLDEEDQFPSELADITERLNGKVHDLKAFLNQGKRTR